MSSRENDLVLRALRETDIRTSVSDALNERLFPEPDGVEFERRDELQTAGESPVADGPPAQSGLAEDEDRERRPIVVTVANVPAEVVEWIWDGWLPQGKLAIIEGDPGEGKSTLTLDLAARVSTGSPMPDGSPLTSPADVLVLSAEDGVADTIRPRLEAAGADLDRIHVLEAVRTEEGVRPPELPTDIDLIERTVLETGARLVIVDPLMAFLIGAVDAYRDQHVRRALHPLKELAERTGATVLVVRHLNKATGGRAVYRGGGSIGIIGPARIGLVVAADPQDESRRVLAVVKSNLAAIPEALAYRLIADALHGCGRIAWEGPAGYTADELLRVLDPDMQGEQAEAEKYLRAELADGTRPATEVEGPGLRQFSKATLRRAKKALGVVSEKRGFGSQGRWYWHLPDSYGDGISIDGHVPPSCNGPGKREHLWGSPHDERDCDTSQTEPAPKDATSRVMSAYGGNVIDPAASDAEEIELERLRAKFPGPCVADGGRS